jgi:hypothetical protein
LSKAHAEDVFKDGIPYTAPYPLVSTSGIDWVFQPHPRLYDMLATNVLEHYTHYKNNRVDKTYIPAYFYLGGAGNRKVETYFRIRLFSSRSNQAPHSTPPLP